ncbi:hypothetical protein V6N13_009272 [Hibiscus sabdariffa]|uniref:Uncharacterized protein n=2 Tax=Hibiscus sabdariffa TaxID=183260 RepID=A0ABR2DHR2_9ROSI
MSQKGSFNSLSGYWVSHKLDNSIGLSHHLGHASRAIGGTNCLVDFDEPMGFENEEDIMTLPDGSKRQRVQAFPSVVSSHSDSTEVSPSLSAGLRPQASRQP